MSDLLRFFTMLLIFTAAMSSSFYTLADNSEVLKQSNLDYKTANGASDKSNQTKPVIAANTTALNKNVEKQPARVGFSDFVVTFIALILVLFLILFVAWLVKRSGFMPGGDNQLIKLLASIQVGQKERVALIQVGEEQILIGIGAGNVEKLHVLKQPLDVKQNASARSTNNIFELALKKYQQKSTMKNKVE